MAGRPRKMAKRVTELEDRAMMLEGDLLELTPGQYLKDDCGPDPLGLCQAWRKALDAALDAYLALGTLGEIVRDKAGFVRDEDGILRDKAGIAYSEPGDELDTPAPIVPARAESQPGPQPDPG